MKYRCIAELESKWNGIVEEIIADGTARTEDGKWRVLIDDFADRRDSDSTFNAEIIRAMLSERKEIAFIEQIDDEFFIDFKPECCACYKSVCDKIQSLKDSFAEQWKWTNARVDELLCQIGELLEEKNAMTGRREDVRYIYSDDGEFFRFVAGFAGDDSGTADANGTPLKVGDTVTFGSGFKRMVILNGSLAPLLSQKTLLEKQAVKTADHTELDIRTADSAIATVSLRSCREDYHRQQEQQGAMDMRFCQ